MLKNEPVRAKQVLNTALNVLFLLASVLEPYMPSFSAKIYSQLQWERKQRDETLIEYLLEDQQRAKTLLPAGHKIGPAQPVFREIKDEEVEQWKKQFGGGQK